MAVCGRCLLRGKGDAEVLQERIISRFKK